MADIEDPEMKKSDRSVDGERDPALNEEDIDASEPAENDRETASASDTDRRTSPGDEREKTSTRSESAGQERRGAAARGRIVARLTGPAFGVLGFLLAGFAPFLGIAPLGAALLAGTDRYLFWIWLGNMAAAFCGAGTKLGTPGALGERILPAVGVTLALMIRLGVRLLFDRDAELEKERNAPGAASDKDAGGKSAEKTMRLRGLRNLFLDSRGQTPFREIAELWSPALFWQLLAAAVALFLPGVCRWGWGGFQFYDLAGLLLGILTAPLAALLLAAWFEGGRWGGAVARCGRTLLLTSLIAALYHPQKSLLLIPVFRTVTGTTAAGAVTSGETIGAGVALIAGRIIAVTVGCLALHRLARNAHGSLLDGAINAFSFSLVTTPAWVPTYLLLFLLDVWIGAYRMGEKTHPEWVRPGIWLAALGGWLWSAVTGTPGSYLYLLPGIVLGTFIYSVFETRADLSSAMPDGARDRELEGALPPTFHLADEVRAAGTARDALGELSEIFYQLSDRMERRSRETEERGTAGGGLSVSVSLPALLRSEKIRVAAADYASMAELAGRGAEMDPEEYRPDPASADRVARRLSPLGITPRGVVVWGIRCPNVFLSGMTADRLPVSPDEVTRILSGTIGTRLAAPVAFSPGALHVPDPAGAGGGLLWRARHRAGISFAGKSLARARGITCGDSMTHFETDDGFSYAFLCDGMGSGSEAAFTAGVCTVMLEKLLGAGVTLPTALRMVNHFLRAKSGGSADECSTTLDLFGVDLYTGQARFVKSGAAVSYVVRGDTLLKIRARTLPLGILPGLDFCEIPFGLADGDTVILLSDGVSDATGDRTDGIGPTAGIGLTDVSSDGVTVAGQGGTRLSWFENLLLHGLPAEPAAAVDTILRATTPTRREEDELFAWDREGKAGEAGGENASADENADDRTVMVMRVRIHG